MKKFKKATWHHFLPYTPEEVRNTVRRLADAGFDMIIPCVKQATGIADFQSKIAPVREEFKSWDPLMVLAEEANRHNIAVHAWSCVAPEGKDSRLLAEHPEYETIEGPEKNRYGNLRLACLNRPEVRDYQAAIYQELLENYPIDGVHLDYVRFGRGFCYCDICRADYKRLTGQELLELSTVDFNPNPAQDLDVWINWRTDVITGFARRIRTAANQAGKKLSAAVFHDYPNCLVNVGQDWPSWVAEGLLDYAFPMNYSRSTKVAAAWVRHNMSLVRASGGKCRLWAGILRPAGMTTERFCDHVDGILDTGIEGVVVFQYPFLTDADLKALSQ